MCFGDFVLFIPSNIQTEESEPRTWTQADTNSWERSHVHWRSSIFPPHHVLINQSGKVEKFLKIQSTSFPYKHLPTLTTYMTIDFVVVRVRAVQKYDFQK